MKATTKKSTLEKKSSRKSAIKQKAVKKKTGFEKAWAFWKTIQVDMSGFTFNREEANADKVFIDSNICLYILDKSNLKFAVAKTLLQNRPLISTQVVTENVNVCLKKFKLPKESALLHAKGLMQACEVHSITNQV